MDNKTQLTPSGIPTTSFADKAKELETVLENKTKTEAAISQNKLDIQDLLNDANYNLPKEVRDSNNLKELEDQLVVYKPAKKVTVESLVYTAANAEGRAISEMVSNAQLMKALEKKFGAKFREFFRQVDDVYHAKKIEKVAEQDEALTKELKTKYIDLKTKLLKSEITLATQEQQVKNVEKYIEFCKSIVTLAPAPAKDKGGQQQGGGQKPQQQQ